MTPALHIRLATTADADAIAAMSRNLIEQGLPWTWQAARVARAIEAANTNVAVVHEAGQLIAFGVMEYLDEDAYLALFAVQASQQRQGIGRTVLQWLEASAAAAGARRIRVDARRDNVAARSFYNEQGYHEVQITRSRYDAGIDGVRLEKWLRSDA